MSEYTLKIDTLLGRGGISRVAGLGSLETEFAWDFMELGCRLERREFAKVRKDQVNSYWSLNHLATSTPGSPAASSKAWDPKATAVVPRYATIDEI